MSLSPTGQKREGLDSSPHRSSAPRVVVLAGVLALSLIGLGARVIALGVSGNERSFLAVARASHGTMHHALARPDIVDRGGRLLASDIPVYWLYADPGRVLDADDASERLAALLPRLSAAQLRRILTRKSRFEWLRRGLTPDQARAIHRLGLPGIGLRRERGRVYPAGAAGGHVLGLVNVDNAGLAGIEHYIDRHLRIFAQPRADGERPSVRLSLDLRIQHILREEAARALATYQAKAAAGVVLDVRSSEVLALTSLPGYDPNRREQSREPDRENRMLSGVYELGSVFKTLTLAFAFDRDVIREGDRYDIKTPLHVGGFVLRDRHAHQRYATIAQIFVHSSNTGAARIARDLGGTWQHEMLARLGLFDRLHTEIGESAAPLVPEVWSDITIATASYGHGIAVTPLAFAAAAAAVVNGGELITPSFLPRTPADAKLVARKVLSARTSQIMRKLLRLNVREGTGRRADVPGYQVGGKTGTALKPVPGGYDQKKVISSFIAFFPMNNPRYLVFVMLDEPQPTDAAHRRTEAAWNAAPTAGRIIARAAPMLGVVPDSAFDETAIASY